MWKATKPTIISESVSSQFKMIITDTFSEYHFKKLHIIYNIMRIKGFFPQILSYAFLWNYWTYSKKAICFKAWNFRNFLAMPALVRKMLLQDSLIRHCKYQEVKSLECSCKKQHRQVCRTFNCWEVIAEWSMAVARSVIGTKLDHKAPRVLAPVLLVTVLCSLESQLFSLCISAFFRPW